MRILMISTPAVPALLRRQADGLPSRPCARRAGSHRRSARSDAAPRGPCRAAALRAAFGHIELIDGARHTPAAFVTRLLRPGRHWPSRAEDPWAPGMWRAIERRLDAEHYDVAQLLGGTHVYEFFGRCGGCRPSSLPQKLRPARASHVPSRRTRRPRTSHRPSALAHRTGLRAGCTTPSRARWCSRTSIGRSCSTETPRWPWT